MHPATIKNAGLFAQAWVCYRMERDEVVSPDDIPYLVEAAIEAAEYEENYSRAKGEEPWVNEEAMWGKGEDWFPPA